MTTILQNFYKTTIIRNWTIGAGDFNISTKPTISSGYLVISPNNSTLREIVQYTATGTNAYGDFITVPLSGRGVGGTTAQTHTIGEPVRMNLTAEHWAELNAQIAADIAAQNAIIANLSITAGNLKATESVYGNTKLSVAPVSAADPIAVGTNDPILIPEWSYHSKLTFTNSNVQQDFSSLPTHDFYKLIFNVNNNGATTGDRLIINTRVNNFSTANSYKYSYFYAGGLNYNNIGNKFLITSSQIDAYSYSNITVELTGKSKTASGLKNISQISGGGNFQDFVLLFGQINGDTNDVSSIQIIPTNAITGTIELWYKDSK